MIGCVFVLLGTSLIPVISAHVPKVLGSYLAVGNRRGALVALAAFLSITLIGMGLQFVLTMWSAQASQGLTRRLRLAIFDKIGNRPGQSMNFQSIGALAHRSTGDVMTIQEFITPGLVHATGGVVQLLFVIVALLTIEWTFALALIGILGLVWVVMTRANRRVQQLSRAAQMSSEAIMNRFVDAIGGYRDLVAAGRFRDAGVEFDTRLNELKGIAIRTSKWHFLANMIPVYVFAVLIFVYYMYSVGEGSATAGTDQLGELLTFGAIVGLVRMSVLELSRARSQAAAAAPSFHEVRKLLEGDEIVDDGAVQDLASFGVAFEQVNFSYGDQAPQVLKRVSFEVPSGSYTAVVGQTGSGKTTLFHMLLRLLEPTSGSVRLGGIPIHDLPLARLREIVGFIPQSPFIFDTTIRHNLLMGSDPASMSDERLAEAVSLAQLEGLIERRHRAGGLDAPVGPGGASLSGGERQRVALGRIFLREPQIIICDEYTANVDNATARLIQDSLARRFANTTRIVITHQLYSVRDADKILVLEGGQISDAGTHDELKERPGLYRDMWEVQRL